MSQIGEAARRLRLDLNLPQTELALRAGVPLRTIQRFEHSGRASMETVVRIAFALGAETSFDGLFPRSTPRSIDDVIDDAEPKRQRARRSR